MPVPAPGTARDVAPPADAPAAPVPASQPQAVGASAPALVPLLGISAGAFLAFIAVVLAALAAAAAAKCQGAAAAATAPDADVGAAVTAAEGDTAGAAPGTVAVALPAARLAATQAPVMAIEKVALDRKARVVGNRRRVAPRSRYTLCLLERLVRLREVTALTDLQRLMKSTVQQENGNTETGGGAGEPQEERDDDEDGVCSNTRGGGPRARVRCWEGRLLWVLVLMGAAILVLVSARHQEFEPMLGYPGEGPSSVGRKEARAQEQKLQALEQQEPVVLEDVDTDDEWVDDMDSTSKSGMDTEAGAWQGDEMDRTGGENSTIGTVGFFNVDGLQVDGTAMEELALEVERTNCMIMGVCDHRSDYVNVRSRVQRAFDSRFAARPGEQANWRKGKLRYAHSCTKNTRRLPNVGECTLAVLPALSNRAGKAIRDCRGWGRYSGTVLVGKKVDGARRDIAVITVYAACTDSSGGGKWQLEQAAELDIAAVHKKSAIAMLQHDLSQLITKELADCHIMIGGDWNQRHNSKSTKKQKQWGEFQTWMKKHSLADVMTELHGEESKKYYSYQNVARRDPATGRTRMHRSKVDHCLVSRALLDCNAVLAAGISARAGVGNSLHFAIYVELDFGCALGIERTNADAADIVDMEPRMPYIRNVQRRAKYSKAIMDGLNQLAVPDKTVATRALVQAYMRARDKAVVMHGKNAGRVHGCERRVQMADGQWVDRLTGKPWMAAYVDEESA